jgi:hypothetical protein
MTEITVSKTKYRLIKIALIITSIILLFAIIDFVIAYKYFRIIKNLGFIEDVANQPCAILGDAGGIKSYMMWTMCCEKHSNDCIMRVYSCVDIDNPKTCNLHELNIVNSGRKLVEQFKLIEKEIKKLSK